MDSNEMYTLWQVSRLRKNLLVEVLNALHVLVITVDNDFLTDAPERQASVNRVEDAIQDAYQVLVQIKTELGKLDGDLPEGSPESLAQRILCEAEEAFGIQSMAHERAGSGEWPPPISVQDYLFWIEDEVRVQQDLLQGQPPDSEDRIYIRALRSLAWELRGLGFQPAPAPWSMAEAANGGGSWPS